MYITIEDMVKRYRDTTFGGRLRRAREDAGLSQEQLTTLLADRYEVTIGRSYISELERNWEANKMPSAEVVAALARALSINGNWLLLIDDNPDLPDDDNGHGISEEAQVIANMVDLLPAWRRRELLHWLQGVTSVSEDTQSEAQRTAEEMRARLHLPESVLGPDAIRAIQKLLVEFVAGTQAADAMRPAAAPVSDGNRGTERRRAAKTVR